MPTFKRALTPCWRSAAQDESVDRAVASILADVKVRGDAAVVEYTNRFDRLNAVSLGQLELTRDELKLALLGLPHGTTRGAGGR